MVIPLVGVVASAFMMLRKAKNEVDELQFDQIDAYRRKIIDLIAQEKKEVAAIPCSGKDVSEFLDKHSSLFELNERNKKWYIHLKSNDESVYEQLIELVACLPLNFLSVVLGENSKEPLKQALSTITKIRV
jgi:hypothetical protein